jgi:mono/diheme cytochrome c family protein
MSGAYRSLICAVAIAGLAAATNADAQPSAERGKAKFDHSCAPCHGPGKGDDGRTMLPGTEALQVRYRGTLPAALEQRSDLTVATLTAFVRNGVGSMPPFRQTELSNTEIADIVAYLAVSSKSPPAR